MSKIITIPFNARSKLYTTDQQFVVYVLRTQEEYINDLIRTRGYIYLNQIYEMLGVEWDPECENICVKRQDGLMTYVEFETFNNSDGSLLMHIHHV